MEILAIYNHVFDKLTGVVPSAEATALAGILGDRIYLGVAPSKNPSTGGPPLYPLAVVQTLVARDRLVADGDRTHVIVDLNVRVVGVNGISEIAGAAALIERLLHKSGGAVVTFTDPLLGGPFSVKPLHRVEQMDEPPRFDKDVIYSSILTRYRARAHKAPPIAP